MADYFPQQPRHPEPDVVTTGTTIVGATGDDCVVLAADTRASLGGRFVTNRDAEKVEPIGDRAAVAFTGSVSSAQSFVKQLRAETKLYEHRHGRTASVATVASMAGRLLRGGAFPVLQLLLVGFDDRPRVYSIGRDGSVMESPYAADGSGMQLAYGTLEDRFRDGFSAEDTRTLVASAVRAATERDTASGDGMTVATLRGDGVELERYESIAAALEATDASAAAPTEGR